MGKSNAATFFKNVKLSVVKHSPEILTGIGIAGMITTTIMAVKATPKALTRMDEVRDAHAHDEDKKEFAKDVIVRVAPVYAPAAIVGGLSIACLIGASSVNARRNAALATAYTLSETALKEYQTKVVETIGEKKEKTVRDAIAKDKVEQNPVVQKEIVITGKGETLCYDALFGRYFKSDIERLKQITNELNRRMRNEDYISLNEFYYEVGLEEVAAGHDLGWNIDRGYIDLSFSSQLTADGTPCLVVSFDAPPRYDFRR